MRSTMTRPSSAAPPRRATLAALGAAAGLLASAAPASAAPRVSVQGGEDTTAVLCGSSVSAQRVPTDGRLRLAVEPARAAGARRARRGSAVVVDRCVDGTWRPLRTIVLGARRRTMTAGVVTGEDATGDLRVRTRTAAGRYGRPAYARIGAGEIVDTPITVRVVNRNRTGIPCLGAPDGRTYTLHGSLVGPRSALDAKAPAVTAYLHGLGYSGFFFRFADVPGYDYGLQHARAGHVSLVIDRLGNPAHDDLPDGNATCIPAQADMADQVIRALRTGNVAGIPGGPRSFKTVLLAGHSLGGFITELTQYSFGSADAIAVIGYTDVPSVLALAAFTTSTADCLLAPRRAHGATGAEHYAPYGRTDADFAAGHFHDIDPEVARIVLRRHNVDSCGDLTSALQGLVANQVGTRLGITVPVLEISGTNDALFTPPTNRLQAATAFLRSSQVQLVELPDTGHAVTLGRTHEAFRRAMDAWLRDHGA